MLSSLTCALKLACEYVKMLHNAFEKTQYNAYSASFSNSFDLLMNRQRPDATC